MDDVAPEMMLVTSGPMPGMGRPSGPSCTVSDRSFSKLDVSDDVNDVVFTVFLVCA